MFRLIIISCLFLATFAASNVRRKLSQERIVGGHDRNITVVPYQVSVQYEKKHKCGGSIIAPKYILTAAHCFRKAGSNYHDKGGKEVKVVRVIRHPHFNEYIGDYDAAILVLQTPLKYNKKVQNVLLANDEPRPGDMALISGWGTMEEDKDLSNLLQSVFVPVVSREVCKRKYPSQQITDQMFCAGYLSGGQDSCDGDSGGPVLVKTKLAGIISWAYGCARKDLPGVNTNIAKIRDWILSQIRK